MSYLFEDYSLDAERRELRRGGELIAVEPRVFDLLEYLIRNRDRVVSKDDLIASVWNGRIVSESALTSRINGARHAIGDSGEQQRLIRTIARKGIRFVGEASEQAESRVDAARTALQPKGETETLLLSSLKQKVTFCRTKDGVSLAVASLGEGPVLVRTAHWVTNLEHDWKSPITGPLLQRLALKRRLVRYDGRGTGLSDRNVDIISFKTLLNDLEAVVDSLKLERFALLGISGGAATAIAYAVRHPDKVTKLMLYGGYALGRNKRGAVDEAKAFLAMHRSPNYWRSFLSLFLPDGTPDEIKTFMDEHRAAVLLDDSIKLRMGLDDIDILDLLPKVNVPTLVFHCAHDHIVPFEQGRLLAASIPNARFVSLDSENHALLPREPAWMTFVFELETFLANND